MLKSIIKFRWLSKMKSKKKLVFEFLNLNSDVIYDIICDRTIKIIQNTFQLTFTKANEYYFDWKREKLCLDKKVCDARMHKRVPIRKPLRVDDGSLLGKNGFYNNKYKSKDLKGILLTKGSSSIYFDNKTDIIKFFDECILAFDMLQGGENEI